MSIDFTNMVIRPILNEHSISTSLRIQLILFNVGRFRIRFIFMFLNVSTSHLAWISPWIQRKEIIFKSLFITTIHLTILYLKHTAINQ